MLIDYLTENKPNYGTIILDIANPILRLIHAFTLILVERYWVTRYYLEQQSKNFAVQNIPIVNQYHTAHQAADRVLYHRNTFKYTVSEVGIMDITKKVYL